MLRDILKEYGQSNLVLLSCPDYPELLEYLLKCCNFIIVEELLSSGRTLKSLIGRLNFRLSLSKLLSSPENHQVSFTRGALCKIIEQISSIKVLAEVHGNQTLVAIENYEYNQVFTKMFWLKLNEG